MHDADVRLCCECPRALVVLVLNSVWKRRLKNIKKWTGQNEQQTKAKMRHGRIAPALHRIQRRAINTGTCYIHTIEYQLHDTRCSPLLSTSTAAMILAKDLSTPTWESLVVPRPVTSGRFRRSIEKLGQCGISHPKQLFQFFITRLTFVHCSFTLARLFKSLHRTSQHQETSDITHLCYEGILAFLFMGISIRDTS